MVCSLNKVHTDVSRNDPHAQRAYASVTSPPNVNGTPFSSVVRNRYCLSIVLVLDFAQTKLFRWDTVSPGRMTVVPQVFLIESSEAWESPRTEPFAIR